VPALVAACALVASLALTPPAPPAPAPLEGDASALELALAHVEHATPATVHSARVARLASPSNGAAAVDFPPPPAILAAPHATALAARAGAVHAQRARERDLRSQAPRAPPPRRS
jgi:hypothetical protein